MTSNNGTEIRVLAAIGVCGSGFRDTSLQEAMRRQPHFIGCDCGSTDPGPSPLGAGGPAFPRIAITREVVAARYGLPPDEGNFFVCDNALAFKASIPRPNFQGDLRDSDNHGGQQYAPLMDIESLGCRLRAGPLTNLPPACMMMVVADAQGPGARRMVRVML